MILEKDFNLNTFTHSDKADQLGINNSDITDEQLQCLIDLHEVLVHIQGRLSIKFARPVQIQITSGFRSKELNEKIGGVNKSQHSLGQACDSTAIGISVEDYFSLIKLLVQEKVIEVDQCINEKYEWVHLSFRKGNNRNQFLKMRIINGKTQYIPA